MILSPHILEHAPLHFEAARESVPLMHRWMPWCHPMYQLSDSELWVQFAMGAWQLGDEYNFAIMDETTGRLLGGIGLNKIDKDYRCANLGYWVRSSERSRGVAVEAVHLAANYAFETLKFNRLEILTAVGNVPSQRVAEKAGALREGIARKRLLIHGVAHDAVVYSLVNERP